MYSIHCIYFYVSKSCLFLSLSFELVGYNINFCFADRSHSHDFAKQFDDSYTKMQAYVKVLENEVAQREKLIELLENGQTFYEVQNDDAMVVANVRIFSLTIFSSLKDAVYFLIARFSNLRFDSGISMTKFYHN